jgi:hypothetical protein
MRRVIFIGTSQGLDTAPKLKRPNTRLSRAETTAEPERFNEAETHGFRSNAISAIEQPLIRRRHSQATSPTNAMIKTPLAGW